MKDRISNIVAWFGFGYITLGLVVGIFDIDTILELLGMGRNYRFENFIMSLVVYGGCATINYLFIGHLRLVPWHEVPSSDTED